MNKEKVFKVGDRVRSTGAIDAVGVITDITTGGKDLGFPWDDDTPHFTFTDERTGMLIVAHPRSLELVKQPTKNSGGKE